MTAVWNDVRRLVEPDSPRWYVEARARGVEVTHRRGLCRTFDSKGGSLGVFRRIGSVVFDKKTRRWHARPYADCNAAELSTLIAAACRNADIHGTQPGRRLLSKIWRHQDKGFTGNPVVGCWVAHQLSAEDLMRSATVTENAPDTIESIAHLVGDHYDQTLRDATAGAQTEMR